MGQRYGWETNQGYRAVWCLLLVCGLGLLVSASAAGQVPSDPQPVSALEVDAYESQHDLARPEAERALALQHRAAGIVEQLTDVESSSYAGVWFDNKIGKLVVPIADPKVVGRVRRLLAANKLNDDYRLDPVQETWSELRALQDSLDKTLRNEIEADVVQTSIDPRRNAVVIDEAAGLAPASKDKIAQAARQSGGNVAIDRHPQEKFQAEPAACTTYTPPGDTIAHRICDRPLRGGVYIEGINGAGGGDRCSAGFAATGRLLGNHFLLTAGHCVQEYGHWRSEDAAHSLHYIGQVEAAMFPGRDYSAIRVKPAEPGNENYWEGGPEGWVSRVVSWGGSQNIPIEYEAASYLGEQICRSGTTTGTSCGTVVGLNKTVNYPQGTVYNLTEANYTSASGDSGGSVWAGNTALGIHSGFTGVGTYIFQEVTEATDAMQVTVGARLPAPPWAETKPAGPVGGREATLQGEVDTAATGANFRFEYGTTSSYGATTSAGYVSAESGHNPIGVNQVVQGLKPLTEYHYRVRAENSAGSYAGQDKVFKTTTAAPLAKATGVSGRTTTSSTLKGEVEAGGLETTYQFEYGETTAYGSVAGVHTVSASTVWASVEAFVGQLKPETTYHYRLKATNSKGSTFSSDAKFSTLSRPPTYLSSFNGAGAGATQPLRPMWPAVDSSGNVYVADRLNNRIVKYNPAGEYISHFGSGGSGNGQFNEPRGVAISPVSGNIFVADRGNSRIQQFTPAGAFVSSLTTNIYTPYDLVIDKTGVITVSDFEKLVQFRPTGPTTYESSTESYIAGQPMFRPGGLGLDAEEDVWVAETGTDRVVEWEKNIGGNGKLAYSGQVRFGSSGSGPGQFAEVYDVVVKPSGNLLVLDRNNSRVQQLTPSGEYQGSFASAGTGEGQIKEPVGIALGQGGVLYLTDTGNNRVQRWKVE